MTKLKTTYMYRVSWAKIRSILYKPGAVVVLQNNLLPVFGIIIDIIVHQVDICYFVLQEYTTHCFLPHFHSFEVSLTSPPAYHTYKVHELADHHPLCVYIVNNSHLIPLKYYIKEEF